MTVRLDLHAGHTKEVSARVLAAVMPRGMSKTLEITTSRLLREDSHLELHGETAPYLDRHPGKGLEVVQPSDLESFVTIAQDVAPANPKRLLLQSIS